MLKQRLFGNVLCQTNLLNVSRLGVKQNQVKWVPYSSLFLSSTFV